MPVLGHVALVFSVSNCKESKRYLSGLCSPVSRISRIRSRYWYSSWRQVCARIEAGFSGEVEGTGPDVGVACGSVADGAIGDLLGRGVAVIVVSTVVFSGVGE